MIQRLARVALLGASVLAWPALAAAIPITYNAGLLPGVPVTGRISTSSGYNNPRGAEYYLFSAASGDTVEVAGTRLAWGYDMAFWIFEGQFDDTSEFGYRFDISDPGYIGFYDNEVAHPGPGGDPMAQFIAPTTEAYTVAVTNSGSYWHFASVSRCGHSSCGCGCSYPFELVVTRPTDVPEPASLLMLALGLTALRLVRRRRRG